MLKEKKNIYLIAFILIILFVIESWKTTKTLQYYKDYYEENKEMFYNTSDKKSSELNIDNNNNLSDKTQEYENSNHLKKDSIFRHGFLPSNFAETSIIH